MKKSLCFAVKLISIIMIIASLSMTVGCDKLYYNRMVEYYTKDDVYCQHEGVIRDITYNRDDSKMIAIYIEIEDSEHSFYVSPVNGTVRFSVSYLDENPQIDIDDKIVFMTAHRIFYDGHHPPLLYIKRGEDVILNFETGKSMYLSWIYEQFG